MAKSTSKKSSGSKAKNSRKNSKKANQQQQQSKDALDRFKMEAASDVGVSLNQGGNLTSQQAGSVGGQMVKKMVQNYKKGQK